MKLRCLYIAATCLALSAALSSCQSKEGLNLYKGDYSFKTSGSITVEKKATESKETTTETISLAPESGQMSVLKIDESSGKVTMNIIGADVLVFDAIIDGDYLQLKETERIITISEALQKPQLKCKVSGVGEKYANTIIFSLKYTGGGSSALYNYNITESDVKCVAKLNE